MGQLASGVSLVEVYTTLSDSQRQPIAGLTWRSIEVTVARFDARDGYFSHYRGFHFTVAVLQGL